MSLSERPATAAARPSLECGSASATMRRPGRPRRPRRLGPDRDDREPRRERCQSPRGRGGREDDEIRGRELLRLELARAVEEHDVGPELVRQERAGTLGGCEQHAARRVAAARRAGPPGSPRTARGRRRRARRPSPGRSRRRAASGRPRGGRSSRAPFALVTTTQSYAETSIGSLPSGSIAISGQWTTSWPSALEPADEILLLTRRPRDDDLHRASGSSSAASAAGSCPERRSIQEPSSAAISAVRVSPS